jgi:dUTP pyrophosphatase
MEAKLYLYVENPELRALYEKHVQAHNHHIDTDPYPNSGFDIFVPETQNIHSHNGCAEFIDFQIKAEMQVNDQPTAFYMYPRSSLSKTPLMLANHVGIIDSGYRGNLKGAFRNLKLAENYKVEKHTRLLQICHPSLCKIRVFLQRDTDISMTSRGAGGFGSTGK